MRWGTGQCLSLGVSNGKGAQLQARGMWSAGQGDDKERFLADLRALRDTAALGYEELAARAHYPSDVIKEAEYGPSLPSLPILAAYVRACEGDVPEWEERWRRLGVEVRVDPGLPVRAAGASPAAVAGARAGVGVAPPDAYDPERIRAALRGAAMRTEQGRRRTDGRRELGCRFRSGQHGSQREPSGTAARRCAVRRRGYRHAGPRRSRRGPPAGPVFLILAARQPADSGRARYRTRTAGPSGRRPHVTGGCRAGTAGLEGFLDPRAGRGRAGRRAAAQCAAAG